MKLENCFGKRKANSLSLPLFLSFGLLAYLFPAGPLAHLPLLPLLPFLFLGRPNSSRQPLPRPSLLSVAGHPGPPVSAVAHLPRLTRSWRNRRPRPPNVVGAPSPAPQPPKKKPSPSPLSLLPHPLHSRIRPSTRKSQPQSHGLPSSLRLRLRISPW